MHLCTVFFISQFSCLNAIFFLLDTPRAKLCRGFARYPLASCGQEQRGWKHWETHTHTSVWGPGALSHSAPCESGVGSTECSPDRWWTFQHSLQHVARSHTPLCLINSREDNHCILLVLNLFSTNFIWCCLIFFWNTRWGVISCSLYPYLYLVFFSLVLPVLAQKNCSSFKYSLYESFPKPPSLASLLGAFPFLQYHFQQGKTAQRIADMSPAWSSPVHNVISSILQSL